MVQEEQLFFQKLKNQTKIVEQNTSIITKINFLFWYPVRPSSNLKYMYELKLKICSTMNLLEERW